MNKIMWGYLEPSGKYPEDVVWEDKPRKETVEFLENKIGSGDIGGICQCFYEIDDFIGNNKNE